MTEATSTPMITSAALDAARAANAEATAEAGAPLPGGFTMLGDAGTACEGDSCLI